MSAEMQENAVTDEVMYELERMCALPDALPVGTRCDMCRQAAQHAFVFETDTGTLVGYTCNHHGREVHKLRPNLVHKDYRMTVAEAEALNTATRAEAERLAAAPTASRGAVTEFSHQPVDRYHTQWDAAAWK